MYPHQSGTVFNGHFLLSWSGASRVFSCESNPCRNGGNCVQLVGSYICTCQAGFTGNNSENGNYNMSHTLHAAFSLTAARCCMCLGARRVSIFNMNEFILIQNEIFQHGWIYSNTKWRYNESFMSSPTSLWVIRGVLIYRDAEKETRKNGGRTIRNKL